MSDPRRGRVALRRGRVSIPSAEYFLTVCTEQRQVGLTTKEAAEAILAEAHAMVQDGTWTLHCAVVMPDHVHLLIKLGERLPLGKTMARLKSKTAGVMRLVDVHLAWERDFFDRHLRPDEDLISVFLYLFLNPYRAGLCRKSEVWPWFYCAPDDWAWFEGMLNEERPLPEWLA